MNTSCEDCGSRDWSYIKTDGNEEWRDCEHLDWVKGIFEHNLDWVYNECWHPEGCLHVMEEE